MKMKDKIYQYIVGVSCNLRHLHFYLHLMFDKMTIQEQVHQCFITIASPKAFCYGFGPIFQFPYDFSLNISSH
jgi:hypothetical protein